MSTAVGTERERIVAAVERIGPVIEAGRGEGELGRRLPDSIVRAMLDEGLFALWTAREYGGEEVSLPTFMTVVESISRIDAASGWVFANLAAGAVLAAHTPESFAREMYASGPNVPLGGSVIPNGRAVPVDGGYRLSGRWPLASGCHHAGWLGGVALVFDGEAPRMGPDGAPDFKNMFFKPEECQILDTWHSLGLRGTGSTDIAVHDVFVPEERMFSLFTTPPVAGGPLYRVGILGLYSMALTMVSMGVARAAIDAFVELAKAKTPTLSQTGLANRPTIHAEVARAEALVQSARAYLYEVAEQLMEAVTFGSGVTDEIEVRRRLACVNASASSVKAVDAMFSLAGSTPVYTGHRLEQCLRDVHSSGQHLVVSPVWWEKTGQYYFGHGLGMP
jgi:alkylation response protein AidB-like acyl-CoA dehydrogenase